MWRALLRAARPGQWRLRLLLALPPLSALLAAALAPLLLLVAPGRAGGFPAGYVLTLLLPLLLAGLACALVCGAASRAVLRRIEPPRAMLRRAALAGLAMAVAMASITAGLIVYTVALSEQAPALSAQPTGPFGASIGTTLAGDSAAAVLVTGLGVLAAARAGRAALGRG